MNVGYREPVSTTLPQPAREPCERQRLQLRASQLEQLLARLHERIRAPDAERAERTAMHRAATEFSHELHHVRQQLEQPST